MAKFLKILLLKIRIFIVINSRVYLPANNYRYMERDAICMNVHMRMHTAAGET